MLEYSVLPLPLQLPSKDPNDLCHLKHSNQWSVNLRPPFYTFSKRNRWPSSLAACIFRPWSAQRVRNCSFFTGNSQIVYWNDCEIWTDSQFKHQELLPYLRICRKLEIAQNAKSCSKRKKLLKIRKVAKKLPSNLWEALFKVVQGVVIRSVADNVMMR